MLQHFVFWLIIFFNACNPFETNLVEWCAAGCNVVLLENGLVSHCMHTHESTKQIILSYPSTIQTSQCLYHTLAYNMSTHNISLTSYDTDTLNTDCPSDCIDWHNGCTECLCINNTLSSLCNLNINTQTCSISYIEQQCQTSKNDLHRHGYNISLLIWFSIINIDTHYELFLPLSMPFDLTSILNKYISQYTTYGPYIGNISCDILYPYNYSNYYALHSHTNDTLNMDEIFHNIVPLHDNINHTYPTFNSTNVMNLSTTQFIITNSSNSPSMTPTLAPILIDSITEYDGNHYNYMPQCALSFVNQHTAMQFMMEFRNKSNTLRDNLRTIMSYYIHNVSILLASDDINETLYEYTQENQHLYVQYVNDSNNTQLQLRIDDINDTTPTNNYQLLLNKSLYSMQFNAFSSYFGNLSAAMPVTLSPTTAPTSPRDCWFDGKPIAHNATYYQNTCYFVFCDNGKTAINDKYCDAQCYDNHTLHTTNNGSICCVTPDGTHCGEANDDCPKQHDCASCVQDNERICAWKGDHCSAVCVGEYCWTDGKCPKRIIIRLHIRGITMQQLTVNQALLNHAIAESLDITEHLVGDYFPTQTPNVELIEVKKAISLTYFDEGRIPKILSADPNDAYVEILNFEIIKAFEAVPGIRGKIVVIDVEYGGFEGENNFKKSNTEHSNVWTVNAFIILLVCGVLVMITICALCYRYPAFSYCCCCTPIWLRRKMKNCTRNHCCECCQRFSFGVLYDDDMSDLIKRRREERRRNLQIRNEIIEEEQHHLNVNVDIDGDVDEGKEKEVEAYRELTREVKKYKSKKKNKTKKKKKSKKKKKKRRKSLSEQEENETIHNDIIQQNEMHLNEEHIDEKQQEIAMTNLRTIETKNTMLYYDRNRDLIEEDETNTIL